ncbi:MAG TPA: hypothetical protein VGB37_08695 [Candidatus Lokiarchaeia archaeon]
MHLADFLQKLAIEIEFNDYSSLYKSPEILREASNQLFEAQAKLLAQEEVLNGVRFLLGITSKESLVQAISRLLECNKEVVPLSRKEIKEELHKMNVQINDRDSTKYLYRKLLKNLKKQ